MGSKVGILFLWCITSLVSKGCSAENCTNHEDCLYKELFSDYNRHVRPLMNSNQSVDVKVSLVVNSLMDIKERDQLMMTVGFFRVTWIDEFLTWDRDVYGGLDHLILTADQIWLPDIAISNSASKFYDITYKRDFHVHISNNGKVRWSFGGIFSSNCAINLKKYPFDLQRCSIEIENWMYTERDVNLSFVSLADEVDVSQLGTNAVWHFHKWEAKRRIKYSNFASLRFTLEWKRKTLYYYVNIVIPIVLMLIVAMGVFWLPAECGEKMSLAITIVLAFSVFQIIIMENTPVNSDVVPEITELVMLVMALATTSLLTSMLVVYISGKSTKTRAPAWLRKVCFKFLARILFMTKEIPYATEEILKENLENATTVANEGYDNPTNKSMRKRGLDNECARTPDSSRSRGNETPHHMMNTLTKEALDFLQHENRYFNSNYYRSDSNRISEKREDKQLTSIAQSLSKIRNLMEEKEASDFVREEWRYIAMTIDRMAFWVTLTIMVTCLTLIAA